MALGGQHVERVGAELCLIRGHKRGMSQLCVSGVSGWLPLYPQPVRSMHVRVQAGSVDRTTGLGYE